MKPIILSLLVAVALSACTNYGKKVTIDGSKGEVYYKGDGVTEADAKKLGTYLKDVIKYFNDEKKQSVQLTKSKGASMSIDLYDNKPVNVFLADTHFKDLKSIPFDEAVVKKLKEKMNPPATEENTTPADSTGNSHQ
jgi:hypothetical protein